MVVHVFGEGYFEIDIEPSSESDGANDSMNFTDMKKGLDDMNDDAQSTTATSVATTTDVGTVARIEKGKGKGKAKGNEQGKDTGPEKGKGKIAGTIKEGSWKVLGKFVVGVGVVGVGRRADRDVTGDRGR